MSIRINNFSAYNQNFKNTKPAFGNKSITKGLTENAEACITTLQNLITTPNEHFMQGLRAFAQNVPADEMPILQKHIRQFLKKEGVTPFITKFATTVFKLEIPPKRV